MNLYYEKDEPAKPDEKPAEPAKPEPHKFGQFKVPADCHIKGIITMDLPKSFH